MMKAFLKLHVLVTFIALLFAAASASQAGELTDGKKTEGIDEQWLKAVVSIEQGADTSKTAPIGTGFLVGTPSNHYVLVTAKHVILDSGGKIRDNLAYRFNQKSQAATVVSDSYMEKLAGKWFLSESEDVACRFIVWGDDFDVRTVPYGFFLTSDRVLPGARVLIPGFPLGLRSEEHAQPIVRIGIVARSDSKSILIDSFVFPGNSGGLVLYSPTIELHGDANIHIESGAISTEMVIGLVSSYIPYVDAAVSQQTGRPRVTFEENSGLCQLVPADAILGLLKRSDLMELDAHRMLMMDR